MATINENVKPLIINEDISATIDGSFIAVEDSWGMSVMLLPKNARKIAQWILDNTEEGH